MPIKFRCQHCRQFLGISRAKAGEVFDCPTCGWTLRVPDLDGTIQPLPGPGLDMGDSKLAKALDELASIEKPVLETPPRSSSARTAADSAGGTGVEGRVIDDRKDEDSDGGMKRIVGDPWKSGENKSDENKSDNAPIPNAGIQTMAEPIDLPPLPAPVPIDFEPRFRAKKPIKPVEADDAAGDDDSATGARPWRSTAQAGNSWKRLLAAAEFGVTEGDSTDEPVKEADPMSGLGSPRPVPDERLLPSPDGQSPTGLVLSGSLIWAAIGVLAVVFAVGFWIGRVTTLPFASPAPTTTSDGEATVAVPASKDVDAEELSDGRHVAFRGRITYRTEEGERKADRGARVIVLPIERKGTAKLSVAGLHSGDAAEDQLFAASGIRTLGGDVSTTDESGEFEIKLPSSGQFYILAMSNSVSRGEATDASAVEEALARYFERPTQLLGRVMHHFEEVRFTGDGVTPWDYSFSQP